MAYDYSSIRVENHLDIDIDIFANFVCDGNKLTDQYQKPQVLNIPQLRSVKRVKVTLKSDYLSDGVSSCLVPHCEVDDRALVKVNDYVWTSKLNFVDINETKSVSFNTTQLKVYVGVRNEFVNKCKIEDAYGSVTLLFD